MLISPYFTTPEVGKDVTDNSLRNVVFPDPFGPVNPTISPGLNVILTSLNMVLPALYCFVRFSVSNTFLFIYRFNRCVHSICYQCRYYQVHGQVEQYEPGLQTKVRCSEKEIHYITAQQKRQNPPKLHPESHGHPYRW